MIRMGAVPEYQLVIVDGPDEGREFSVSGAAVIGRDPSAGIVLSDTEASRRHATVMIQEGREGLLVEDLGSTNGSFLNGQKIEAGHGMVEGDKLRIGRTVFELRVVATGTVAPEPEPDELQATAMRSVPSFASEPPAGDDTGELPATSEPPPPGGGAPSAPDPAPAAAAPPPPAAPPPAPPPPPAAPPPPPAAPPPSPGPQAPAPGGFPPVGGPGGGPQAPAPAPGGFPPVGGPGAGPQAPPPAPGGFPPVGAPPPGPPGGFGGPPPGATGVNQPTLELKFPLGRAILFSIFSGGLWGLYYFYVVRQQFTREVNGNDQAGLQTLGLFVPILNLFIIYWLWRDIAKARQQRGMDAFDPTVYLLVAIIGGAFTFGIASLVIYFLVFSKTNEYWDRATNGQARDRPIETVEWVLLVVGLLWFAFWFFIILLGAILANEANDAFEFTFTTSSIRSFLGR